MMGENRHKLCFEILKNVKKDCIKIENKNEEKLEKKIEEAKNIINKMFKNKENKNEEKLESIFHILKTDKKIDKEMDKKYYNITYIEEYKGNAESKEDRESLLNKYEKYCENIEECNVANIQKMLNKLREYTSFIPINNENIDKYVSVYQYYKNLCLIVENLYYNDEASIENQLLYGIDLSGIQSFIYTIHTSGALKMLRARSFYLEILVENIIDQILEKVGLSRVNLIYSGAGHAYLLLPNSEQIKKKICEYEKNLKKWCRCEFDINVCIFIEKIEVNMKADMFEKGFKELAEKLQNKKKTKYTISEINELNNGIYELDDRELGKDAKGSRECAVCLKEIKNDDNNKNDDILRCENCKSFNELSNKLIELVDDEENEKNYENNKEISVLLPNCEKLLFGKSGKIEVKNKENAIIRRYNINNTENEENDNICNIDIYLGNYASTKQLSDFIKKYGENECEEGINRIGVLRADVDNLGKTFVNGFRSEDKNLITGAELSSKLALFFKYYINKILQKPKFILEENKNNRNISIIYSGGDDIFVIGEFLDIIEFAIDIQEDFCKFTNGKLTISAGIGLFNHKDPVAYMAEQTGDLESCAKDNINGEKEKDAIALFSEENVYNWKEFREKVLEEKYKEINKIFNQEKDNFDSFKGNTFLHNILQYLVKIKNGDSINIVRLVYLLGKFRQIKDEKDEENEKNEKFLGNIYKWAKNCEDRRQLITAIGIYIFMNKKENKYSVDINKILNGDKHIEEAENVIKSVKKCITSTKLMKIFKLISKMYTDVVKNDDENMIDNNYINNRLSYTKMKICYEMGRDNNEKGTDIRKFGKETLLVEILDKIKKKKINKINKIKYIKNFYEYMESLVAYHKYLLKDR